jgi:Family of unknown function (DUF5995)
MVLESSVESAAGRLQTLGRRLLDLATTYECARDARAVASHTLGQMQLRLAERLHELDFDDPDWIADLAEALHGRFLQACQRYDAGQPVPRPYAEVFGALTARRCTVFEDLVYPLVVHIVHDLPHALVDVDFLDPRRPRLADFDRINEALQGAIHAMERNVHRRYDPRWLPLVRILDRLGGRFDRLVTGEVFRLARAQAWYDACRLLDPTQRAAVQDEIERAPGRFVRAAQQPPISEPLRWCYRGTRFLFTRFPLNWPARTPHPHPLPPGEGDRGVPSPTGRGLG